MVAPLYTTASGLLFHAGKILVLTIGLPARGKTHISRALERYLRWMGVKTQVAQGAGGAHKVPPDYFTPGEKSPETIALRKKISEGCERLIWDYFNGGGQVVIYDANNGAKATRNAIAERFEKEGIHVVMLESLCDNKDIIEGNIRSDYYHRIKDHEKHYETIDDQDWPFIKIMNVGEKITLNKIEGYLQSRIVFFLMNIHNRFPYHLLRSGQSLIEHSYKADSDLSPHGWEYAANLKDYVLERRAKSLEARSIDPTSRKLVGLNETLFTMSTRSGPPPAGAHTTPPGLSSPPNTAPTKPRTSPTSSSQAKTATPLRSTSTRLSPRTQKRGSHRRSLRRSRSSRNRRCWRSTLGFGTAWTPDQAKKYYAEDWERFVKDPYSFRAPRAESYHDLSVRLEPILIELEREQEDLLIIGHASVIRCLLAYLIGLPASEIPAIEIARGDLLEVVPTSYGVQSHQYHFWDGPGRSKDGRTYGP
ncbi:6PF2K-domain-containing protein [Coprinellus micaceus]|uniref:6PF2K-domain-containing protein n=1 Tax=Coprinellus micaceus TaxID=71717 RepID=A0A4Y7TLH3_COPMI|nr:6PF2K-domain-containing protein [Coprinellus micaceus]